MKEIVFMADSTCDLSDELLNKYDILRFPLHIHLDEKEYADGEEIGPEDIYCWSEETKETPKTSACSIFDAKKYLTLALQKGKKVICFCISESMSSCYSVLNIAVGELEAEDRVHVLDSGNLSTGIGLQLIEAAVMAEQGRGCEEILEFLKNIKSKVRTSFVVDTLTYLHRGGRCSGVAALAGNALKLHPLIYIKEGKMYPGKKYRGKMDKVIINYVQDMREELLQANQDYVFITHSGCDKELLMKIKSLVEELNYFENIYITRAGGVVSSHCGPGTLGVIFRKK